MNDSISRQAAIVQLSHNKTGDDDCDVVIQNDIETIKALPSAEPEIIRCKDCKHWTQSMGKMNGYGLGRCDFHDADLVACNGFCYWAERRTDD